MQAKRFVEANPDFKVNTDVTARPDPPEVVFKFADDTEVRPKDGCTNREVFLYCC